MGIVRKQSAYSTVFIYIGFAIGALNTLWLIAHFIPKDPAGLTNLLNTICVPFAMFATLGSLNALYKFYPFYRSYLPNERNDFPFLVILINLAGCLIFIIAAVVFKGFIARKFEANSPLFVSHYYLIFPYTICYSCLLLLEGFCWTLKKTIVANIARELIYRIINSIIILLYVFNIISIETFLFLFTFSYLPSVLVMLVAILKDGTIKIYTTLSSVTRRMYNKIFVFASYHFTGMLIAIIPPAIDNSLIAGISTGGLSNVWIYSIPVFMVSVMDVPFRSMAGITTALISEAWKNRDLKKIEELYKKTSLNLLVFGMGLFGILYLCSGDLIRFLPRRSGYEVIAVYFLIKGIAKLVDLGLGMNAQILLLSKYWRIDFYTSAAFIFVNVVLDYVLIKKYGVIGAAYGSSIALVFYNLMRYFYLWKLFRIQPFGPKTLTAVTFAVIVFFAIYFIPYIGNLYVDAIFRASLFSVLYASAVIYLRVSEDINAIYYATANKFFRKN